MYQDPFKMMKESDEDIENPPPITSKAATNPHNNTPSNDPNKKIKIGLLSTFLLVVLVLCISLGVVYQGNPSKSVENEEGGGGGEFIIA